jgi:hypothetical protein
MYNVISYNTELQLQYNEKKLKNATLPPGKEPLVLQQLRKVLR